MCANVGDTKKDWGTKCTIDAKKLWKIFFITPGDGAASIKVCDARSVWDGSLNSGRESLP
jgi:hypothetical protein